MKHGGKKRELKYVKDETETEIKRELERKRYRATDSSYRDLKDRRKEKKEKTPRERHKGRCIKRKIERGI